MNMPASPHAAKKTMSEKVVRRTREDMLREILRLPLARKGFFGSAVCQIVASQRARLWLIQPPFAGCGAVGEGPSSEGRARKMPGIPLGVGRDEAGGSN